MNRSVKNIARIARKYSYSMEVVNVGRGRAYLSISGNFLRSPYPRHLTSDIRSYDYVKKVFDDE